MPDLVGALCQCASNRDDHGVLRLWPERVAERTSIYMRYDGDVGGGTDNHAINVGVRFTW